MNLGTKIINFIREVRIELKKVNWPTRKETIKYTMVVIGLSASVAIFLGIIDYIFSHIINRLIF